MMKILIITLCLVILCGGAAAASEGAAPVNLSPEDHMIPIPHFYVEPKTTGLELNYTNATQEFGIYPLEIGVNYILWTYNANVSYTFAYFDGNLIILNTTLNHNGYYLSTGLDSRSLHSFSLATEGNAIIESSYARTLNSSLDNILSFILLYLPIIFVIVLLLIATRLTFLSYFACLISIIYLVNVIYNFNLNEFYTVIYWLILIIVSSVNIRHSWQGSDDN